MQIQLPVKTTYFIFLISIITGFSCRKNNTDSQIPSITINSIAPVKAKYGATDTIRGNGFGNNVSNLKVFFNETQAAINSITDSLIIVTVPKGAESGSVSILKGSEKAKGPFFYYSYTTTVYTLAGKGYAGYKDGPIEDALFRYPHGIAIDAEENIFIADFGNNRIRKISPNGIVTTIAGNGVKGYKDGPAMDAQFTAINGIVFDKENNLYIADGSRLRKLSASNHIISTLAGNGEPGNLDGRGVNARFTYIYGITIDTEANLYVSDVTNNNIRKITPDGNVLTVAGYIQGFEDGYGKSASFNFPGSITMNMDKSVLYVADASNFRIRTIVSGNVKTYAGSGNFGYKDGRLYEAEFRFPTGISIDAKNNVYVCGEENVIRKIDVFGNVTTIAGSGNRGYKDGNSEEAMFDSPIYLLNKGNNILYVTDLANHCIRKIIIE